MPRQAAPAKVEAFNAHIVSLTQEYQIPLWDYWSALHGLEDQGLWVDGVHPSFASAGHTADFSPQYLRYGMTCVP